MGSVTDFRKKEKAEKAAQKAPVKTDKTPKPVQKAPTSEGPFPEQTKQAKPAAPATPPAAKKPEPANQPPKAPVQAKSPEQKPATKSPDKEQSTKSPAKEKPAPKPTTPITVVRFDRTVLQEALGVALDFVEKKETMPILAQVCIRADGREAEFRATDIEQHWKRPIPCDAGKPVEACAPARLLYAEVRALQPDIAMVELAVYDGWVSVNGRCMLPTMPAAGFPAFPRFSGEDVSIHEFSARLGKVVVAAGDGDTRYTLNSVLVDRAGGSMVATDGHRLHMEPIEKADKAERFILPRKAARIAVKYKAAGALKVGKDYVGVPLMGGTMAARLVKGNYPDYKRIVPKRSKLVVTVSSAELLAVLDGAVPVSRDKALRLTFNGALVVESNNPEAGEYRWELACESKKDRDVKSLTIGIHAGYLSDALRSFPRDRSEFRLTAPGEVCVINGGALVTSSKS